MRITTRLRIIALGTLVAIVVMGIALLWSFITYHEAKENLALATELKTNFLGTSREGVIYCEGTPAHIGRRTMVWDARVWDEKSGRNIALFRCTQMILPKQQ